MCYFRIISTIKNFRMKSIKFLLLAITVCTMAVSFSSCGSKSSANETTETVDKSGKEYTAAFICPMHCEGSGSASAGKCPVCGMDYVANKDLKKDDHGHDHDGHDHGDHEGHNH